jgi:hypothetical protein
MDKTLPEVGTRMRGRPSALHPERHSRLRLLTLALCLAVVVKATSIETTAVTRLAFGLVFLVVVLTVLGAVGAKRPVRGLNGPLLWLSLLMVLEAIQIPATMLSRDRGARIDLPSALTDLTVMLLPGLLAIAIASWNVTRERLFTIMCLVGAAGFAGTGIVWLTTPHGTRFEAPSVLAIAVAWTWALFPSEHPRSYARWHRARLAGWLMVVLLVPIAISSGSRTALGVWVLVCIVTLALSVKNPRVVIGGIATAAVALVLLTLPEVQSAIQSAGPEIARQARLATFQSGQQDVSLEARAIEVHDALRTMHMEGDLLTNAVGFGHGATYVPTTDLIAVNMDEFGRIHNIHFTPVMILFRYGWTGLALYVVLVVWLLAKALREVRRRKDPLSILLFTSLLAVLADAMVRNAFADPTFSLVVAAVAVSAGLQGEEP